MFKIPARTSSLWIVPGAEEIETVAQRVSCIRPYRQDEGKSLKVFTGNHIMFTLQKDQFSAFWIYLCNRYCTLWGISQIIHAACLQVEKRIILFMFCFLCARFQLIICKYTRNSIWLDICPFSQSPQSLLKRRGVYFSTPQV